MTQSDRRDEFLLEYYKACWDNVTRSEDAAWKMFAAYAAVFAGLAVASNRIGPAGFLSIFILFTFLAIALCLNANLWFVRNIGMISNLEQEFLRESDYDVIIPKSYKNKVLFASRVTFEGWWVFIAAYFFISLIVSGIFYPQISDLVHQIAVIAIYVGSTVCTIVYGLLLNKRHVKFMNSARGLNKVKE